ncbi:CCA tRNA nucleotidyltransferase [bacterium]|nr:CCA tRNA nucleotidyltransferase [bacterium]
MNTRLISKIKKDEILNSISSHFRNKIYLVGGAVRDMLLDRATFDRDLIVTDEEASVFAKDIADYFQGKYIPLDEGNKIYRVVLPDKLNFIDITNPIENSMEKDLTRRDLTINAVALDINTGEILDYTGGLKDFENKIIKGISEENFIDDPLRLLRIFRFHSILGFKIDSSLMNIAKNHSKMMDNPARERVEYELMKLFGGKYAHSALSKMDECGILEKLFPFVKELKQVTPNAHHHLDLFNHSIETVKQLELLYENSRSEVKNHLERVDFGGFSRLAHLKLACFVHDIGKFSTWTIEEDTNRHRFIKHDDVGAKMVPSILKNLAFSNKQIEYIKLIVKKHMYATMVVSSPDYSEKTMMRYIRKMEDNSIDAIMIAKADRLSALGPEITDEIVEKNLSLLDDLTNFYIKTLETLKPLPKLLDGNDVMKILNISPSPQLGRIMNALHEAQINSEVLTKEDAINFVQNFQA